MQHNMTNQQLVKNKVLLNKIAEYFAKHPKKQSVVVRTTLGEGSKVYWRAIREAKNRFSITEVKTVTESFIFEVGNAGSQPAAKGLKKTKDKSKAKVDASKKKDVPTQNPADGQPVVAEKPIMSIKMVTHQ